MKGLQNGIPIAVLAAMASAQGIGGSHGVDIGNDAALGFSNDVYSEVNAFSKDDHSTDIDTNTNIVAPQQPPPRVRPRVPAHEGVQHEPRGKPASLVSGPGGVDVGDAATFDYVTKAGSKVHSEKVDDHHVDINEEEDLTVLPPPPPPPRPHFHAAHPPLSHGDDHKGHDEHPQGHGEEHDSHGGDQGHGEEHGSHGGEQGHGEEHDSHGGEQGHGEQHGSHGGEQGHGEEHDSHGGEQGHGEEHDSHGGEQGHGEQHGSHGGEQGHGEEHDSHGGEQGHGEQHDSHGGEQGHGEQHDSNGGEQGHGDDSHGGEQQGQEGQEGHHHERRGVPHSVVVDGPGGVDVGNAAANEFENKYFSRVKATNIDNHSLDVDEKTNILTVPPHPPSHGPRESGHGPRGGHEAHGRRYAPTVVGGPHSVDIGNEADLDFMNAFKSDVNSYNEDNHSVKIDKTTHIVNIPPPPPPPFHHGPPHGPPHGDGHGHDRRDQHGKGPVTSVVDGPHTVDVGDAAEFGFKSELKSEVSDYHEDDHSVDIKKTTDIKVLPPPHEPHLHGPPHRDHERRDRHGNGPDTVVGGPHGVDVGNAAGFASKNAFSSDVNSYNEDDHSVDIDKATDIKILSPPHPPHHGPPYGHERHGGPGKRAYRPYTVVVDGPGGVDVGNANAYDQENSAEFRTTVANIDDHSVDIDEKTDIKVLPPPHPPHHGPPYGHERHGGPGKRAYRPYTVVVDGPGGVDVGNANAYGQENSAEFRTTVANIDDHSVDIDEKTDIKVLPPPHPPHHGPPYGHERHGGPGKRAYSPDTVVVDGPGGGDVGDANAYGQANSADLKTNVAHSDDHSVKAHSDVHEIIAAPPQDEYHEEERPVPTCSTLTRKVVHTVTRTVEGHHQHEATHAPEQEQHHEQQHKPQPQHDPQPQHQPQHDPQYEHQPQPQHEHQPHPQPQHEPQHQPQYEPQHQPQPQHDPQPHPQPQHEPQHQPQYEPQHQPHDPQHDPQPQYEPQHQPQHEPQPQHEDEHGQQAKTPAPHGHENEDSSHAAPSQTGESPTGVDALHPEGPDSTNAHAPASSQAYGHAQPSGNGGSDFDVPSPATLAHIAQGSNAHAPAPTLAAYGTPSASNAHMVLTSTLTVAHASSFHKIPVYVPMPSNNGVGAGESHASSTPSAHIPVGVDAEQHTSHGGYSHATPSPSSQGVMFTGGATHFSPSVGVISLFCGVMGLLAYVL